MKAEVKYMTETREAPQVCVASRIVGTGMSVPEREVTNDYFASYLDTTDEWIQDRTGIKTRFWADGKMSASELAEPASREAISQAGLQVEDIDGIVFATVTPDCQFPSTACFLQHRLGIKNALAFDVVAVCSGFIYGLVMADSLIASGQCRNVLVVGSELYSRIVDPKDRTTCVLFGDGAGAVVLSSAVPQGSGTGSADRFVKGSARLVRGIYASKLGSDGTGAELLYVPNGTAYQPTPESLAKGEHYLKMAGREVFKLAVRNLTEVSQAVLDQAGIGVEEVDYCISHQANVRILRSFGKQLGLPDEKVLVNIDRYGNTSAASIPILLAESVAKGLFKPGDLLLLNAFGGGFTWGAVLLRW